MESAVDLLPNEILHTVFSYLTLPERLNACLVCKKWLEILNSKLLLKDILVHINDNVSVPVFSSTSRNFLNFSFEFIIVDKKYYELFKRFSSRVEYISFENCEIWKREPVTFNDLKYDNLKVLRIIDCNLWTLFPCLPNLTELYLTGKSTITDDGFSILQKTMKHLQVLSLLCTVSCDRRVINRFYPLEMTYETNPSSCILSLPAVCSFVSERASSLKEMRLFPEITSSALKNVSSIKDLYLYKIDLTSCYYCANGLIDLFKNQPMLKIINLNGVFGIKDNIIDALCSLLPDVEEVYLHSCVITNKSLSKLFQLTKLYTLDIGGGQAISAHAFNEAISNLKAVQIKSLNLSRKIKDSENVDFDALFKKCKCLTYLDLSCNKIPDTVIHIISENLLKLEYLCLKHCDITDYGLTGSNISLSNLKNLKQLNLSECAKITDNAIIEAIKFQHLELLYVSGCNLQRDAVQTLLLQNPSIKKIYWDYNDPEHPEIGKKRKRDERYQNFMEDRFVSSSEYIYYDNLDEEFLTEIY